MKVTCIQMDTSVGEVERNFALAEQLIREAAGAGADTVVLPETWNSGYFPKERLADYCDRDGIRVKALMGALARELNVNIVAGSVSNVKSDKIYNTSYTFNRQGACVAEYDKTHLFTPMLEHHAYTPGDHLSVFELDGVKCGILICYDIRFPELTRTLTVNHKLDILFLSAQWPLKRLAHLQTLSRARAIENQMFVVCTNSCDKSTDTVFAGGSAIYDPWGTVLASAGGDRELISADCDLGILSDIRSSINVFADRRQELYHL